MVQVAEVCGSGGSLPHFQELATADFAEVAEVAEVAGVKNQFSFQNHEGEET
jgi:hypothetical protein